MQGKNDLNKYTEDSNYRISVTFDDLFIVNNIRILKACKRISYEILNFIKDNNIEYSSANTNIYSRKLVKKLLYENTKYIEDKYSCGYYVESFSRTNGKPPKLPKGLLNDDLKIKFL